MIRLLLKKAVIIFYILIFPAHSIAQDAVIVVPVANLFGDAAKIGARVPLHQALFNEPVILLEETQAAALIEIKSAFYINNKSLIPQKRYWTAKKDVALIKSYPAKKQGWIPFLDSKKAPQRLVQLTSPWQPNPDDSLIFAAGTIFVADTQKMPANPTKIIVRYIDPITKTIRKKGIPKDQCLLCRETARLSLDEKRKLFISLVKTWAHQPDNAHIPYLFGGSTFIKAESSPYQEENIFFGLDCSGLILRAAHIAGISSYQYKNTRTIKELCPQVTDYSEIQSGDLIVIQGHVMIISDLDQSIITEARGYQHGYGRVHSLPISNIFQGIYSVKDLWYNAIKSKKIITRLDKNGNPRDQFSDITIHRLC